MGAQGELMQALGEYANTTLKVHSRQLDSNIGPSCCEASVLTTVLLNCSSNLIVLSCKANDSVLGLKHS